MKSQFRPRDLLLLFLASWIDRRQHDVIEYLRTENRVLRGNLGNKRILLNDGQQRIARTACDVARRQRLSRILRYRCG
jgi:hypothetical protein